MLKSFKCCHSIFLFIKKISNYLYLTSANIWACDIGQQGFLAYIQHQVATHTKRLVSHFIRRTLSSFIPRSTTSSWPYGRHEWTDNTALLGEQEFSRKSNWLIRALGLCLTQKYERPHCSQVPLRRVSVHWFQSGNHIYWAFSMCRAPCKALWEGTLKKKKRKRKTYWKELTL